MTANELQDARNAAAVLRATGATGETLVELVDSLVSMLPPKRRSPRMLERTPLVRVGDIVPVAVDLSPLTDFDVVMESDVGELAERERDELLDEIDSICWGRP